MNNTELIETVLNERKPIEARKKAYALLEKVGIDTLPISHELKAELVWTYVFSLETPEQRNGRTAAKLAQEDAEHKFCANCFQKTPADAPQCPRCSRDGEWVLPSTVATTGGPEGHRLRTLVALGAETEKKLTEHLYLSGPDREQNRAIAAGIIRIMRAAGHEVPAEPLGNKNVIGGQFRLTDPPVKPSAKKVLEEFPLQGYGDYYRRDLNLPT